MHIFRTKFGFKVVKQISDNMIVLMWLCHLSHYWQKWHKLNTSHNSSGNTVNA